MAILQIHDEVLKSLLKTKYCNKYLFDITRIKLEECERKLLTFKMKIMTPFGPFRNIF